MQRLPITIAFITCSLLACACAAKDDVASLSWRITATLAHGTDHFTQGLVVHDDVLIESSGLYGRSRLMIKSKRTGEVLRSRALPANWFAEGATVWRGKIVMLTWRERIAQWFDLDLKPLSRMTYGGEGWGITHDGTHLITSDGSATLRFRRAEDFSVIHEREVRDANHALRGLNELEYARGLIYANVWQTDRIAVIDPLTGNVCAWLDLQALKLHFDKPANWNAREHVLNGIAYDAASDRFYVTGKNWPALFELEVEPADCGR
ncbi:glutaminyl-peptide cyclotransferase [Sinimarinibacterium thermocellulolyticum]|uniref:Glutaminyl-peptide cyclotransferase n=1 Tax=Sinimarinibacterium thermocellulolyticum TaxID=3170016 RepID=A0ABV2A6P8_9GAMM